MSDLQNSNGRHVSPSNKMNVKKKIQLSSEKTGGRGYKLGMGAKFLLPTSN